MWTPPALASEARPWSGKLWRVVESQSQVATLKLVDTLDEQDILEAELEGTKPLIPMACAGMHYLLAAPFRYAPYRYGSRFRRAHQPDGVFYGAEHVETAVAEEAFYRLLFFLDSPGTSLPKNPQERTAFCVLAAAESTIDLGLPPFSDQAGRLEHPTDYASCQDLADVARTAGIGAIRYRSIRDPERRANVALMAPASLVSRDPEAYETWHIFLRATAVQARREMPRLALEFPFEVWAHDPRIPMRIRGR